MIRLEHICKSYDGGKSFAVNDVSLEVAPGSLLAMLGQSGSGKTTTLKMINRLIELGSGRILIDGNDISTINPVELRRKTGYVFQGIGLFPHRTVSENIATVPGLLGWEKANITARVVELLELVGLDPEKYAARYPHELSGGQQQRVGVARALIARPGVLLMDEPFGALDPLTRAEMQEQFNILRRSLKLTAVMVTHDMMEALLLADYIAVMKEGRVVGYGTPSELLNNPPHAYVRALLNMPKRQAEQVERIASSDS